jgi:mono/diheme cytochrome c family protein
MKTSSRLRINLQGGLTLLLMGAFFCAFNMQQKSVKWDAPASAKSIKNPVAKNAESVSEGKALYTKHCKSCHGTAGKGDGPKAENLDVSCGNFTKPDFQKQSDGEIFWKMTNGKDPMPTFKAKTSEEERWQLVAYVRTLK